ncbi:MAG TPA: hypothetical protein VGC05_16010, partial [Mycobacterium sp.]
TPRRHQRPWSVQLAQHSWAPRVTTIEPSVIASPAQLGAWGSRRRGAVGHQRSDWPYRYGCAMWDRYRGVPSH